MYLPQTQQQIVDYLSKNRSASARELSDALGSTRANIHHHLNSLRDQGIIEPAVYVSEINSTRGRPWKYYRLAKRYTQNNLEELARVTIRLLKNTGHLSSEAILAQMAESILREYRIEQNLTRRLTQAIYFLNRRHYQAHWEASRTGPRVIMKHCPFQPIIEEFPELCVMDRLILQRLIGIDCQQLTKISLEDPSISGCSFLFEQS